MLQSPVPSTTRSSLPAGRPGACRRKWAQIIGVTVSDTVCTHGVMTMELVDSANRRTIAGIAYWLPHQGSVSSGWLLNIDRTSFDNYAPALPTQTRLALHGLINF